MSRSTSCWWTITPGKLSELMRLILQDLGENLIKVTSARDALGEL